MCVMWWYSYGAAAQAYLFSMVINFYPLLLFDRNKYFTSTPIFHSPFKLVNTHNLYLRALNVCEHCAKFFGGRWVSGLGLGGLLNRRRVLKIHSRGWFEFEWGFRRKHCLRQFRNVNMPRSDMTLRVPFAFLSFSLARILAFLRIR